MEKKMGIYKIVNLNNGKFYLGSSKNLRKRKREHFWALKRNTHSNSYLQNAFNKHGRNAFKFIIVKQAKKEENLLNIEQRYLDKTNACNREIGYNINELATGGGLCGEDNPNFAKPMSEEQKQQISQTLAGHKVSKETRIKMSKNRKGKCVGKNNPLYGRTVTEEERKRHSELMKGRFTGAENPSARAIVKLTPEGQFIKEYQTIKSACEENNVYASNIVKACKGEYNQTGGFKWKYLEDYQQERDTA